jgi:hypothetical protein
MKRKENNMGTLTPGATYIYERDGNTVYARETGKTERFVVGKTGVDFDSALWGAIIRSTGTNTELKEAVDKVLEIYFKDHD